MSRTGVAVGGPLDGKTLQGGTARLWEAPEVNEEHDPWTHGFVPFEHYDGAGNLRFVRWQYEWDGERWIGKKGPTKVNPQTGEYL